jgi:plastocyanin
MKYARYFVGAMVLLLLFTFSAFGEEPKPATKQDAQKVETQPAAEHQHVMGKEKRVVAVIGADGVQRAEVLGGEYYFDPNIIVVKVNKAVELTVKKEPGYVPHNMLVKEPEAGINFKVDLDAKKPEIVKFTPTKVGKYPMYCDKKLLFFKSHRERGMEGIIEVVE